MISEAHLSNRINRKLNICIEELGLNNRRNKKILHEAIDPVEFKALHGPTNTIFMNLLALSTTKIKSSLSSS
jgi:hypothetical protein